VDYEVKVDASGIGPVGKRLTDAMFDIQVGISATRGVVSNVISMARLPNTLGAPSSLSS
jgi:hypothetical protein